MTTTTSHTKYLTEKFKDILGPSEKSVDRDARERLLIARVCLLIKKAFFGYLA